MPHKNLQGVWLIKKENFLDAPSISIDKIDVQEEAWQRYRACQFLERVAGRTDDVYLTSRKICGLELDKRLLNKAKVFLHRFYLVNSFKSCEYHEVCGALLFLVSKIGRSSRNARLLIDVVKRVALSAKKKPCGEKEIQSWTHRLSYWEIEILSSLRFDLNVCLPHDIVTSFFKKFPKSENVERMVYHHLDDSLRTTLVLRASPGMIAYAAVHLALKNSENKIDTLPDEWWKPLGIDISDLELVAEEIKCAHDEHETKRFIMELYLQTPNSKTQPSP